VTRYKIVKLGDNVLNDVVVKANNRSPSVVFPILLRGELNAKWEIDET
jgi:hypothetical protein